jgi:curved DNA-binding protein CbpA
VPRAVRLRPPLDPYRILQVPPDAAHSVIVAAYRALARRYHPDIVGDGAARSMIELNAAWEILRDPVRRREYDRQAGASRPPSGNAQANGVGAAGPAPGRPWGSVLDFGRHLGWSLGEIARVDPGYLEWLEGKSEGRPYLDEIDALLKRIGYRQTRETPTARRGWLRRAWAR